MKKIRKDIEQLISPVGPEKTKSKRKRVRQGIALCLSGGGYRAMLFHVGALWRLNEARFLKKLAMISSVSGGSITAGVLGMNWSKLDFDKKGIARQFVSCVVEPIRSLADTTIDIPSVIGGLAIPRMKISDTLATVYGNYLFGDATLQDLPKSPCFVINATNVQSGVLWKFMRSKMADWRVGEIKTPRTLLAVAVAASSAFPPVLSPVKLNLKHSAYRKKSGSDLHKKPFTTDVVLTDGGVYDNLGLETAWKLYDTILVSDGGGKMEPEATPRQNWVSHYYRINNIIDNQVRSLRKRQVVGSYVNKSRKGAYWGIRSKISNYKKLKGALRCPFKRTTALADISTRLSKLDPDTQERLINWGYAVCDAALRKHVKRGLTRPKGFVYPKVRV